MFCGIIQATARVVSIEKKKGSNIVLVTMPKGWKLKAGESVAVNGICSTVRTAENGRFEIEHMPETLSKTTAGGWRVGDIMNLERSLRFGDRVSGHFIQGHVDAKAKVISVRSRGSSRNVTISIPRHIASFVAPRGSIAADGVSLTVASLRGALCTLALVSYTLKHTNLDKLKEGDEVNIETDMIARYMAQLRKK